MLRIGKCGRYRLAAVERVRVIDRRSPATGRIGRIRGKGNGEGSVAICRYGRPGRQARTALIREADRAGTVHISERQGFGLTFSCNT